MTPAQPYWFVIRAVTLSLESTLIIGCKIIVLGTDADCACVSVNYGRLALPRGMRDAAMFTAL